MRHSRLLVVFDASGSGASGEVAGVLQSLATESDGVVFAGCREAKDGEVGPALCVVDLDTVMAGCVLFDFGDMARSICSLCPEDGLLADGVTYMKPVVDGELFRSCCAGARRSIDR